MSIEESIGEEKSRGEEERIEESSLEYQQRRARVDVSVGKSTSSLLSPSHFYNMESWGKPDPVYLSTQSQSMKAITPLERLHYSPPPPPHCSLAQATFTRYTTIITLLLLKECREREANVSFLWTGKLVFSSNTPSCSVLLYSRKGKEGGEKRGEERETTR